MEALNSSELTIAGESDIGEVWIEIERQVLDLNLVVVDRVPSSRVRNSSVK